MKTIRQADLKGKRVLLRVDFNVPLNSGGEIEDDRKIKAALPTIKYILDQGAEKITTLTHLGRPKGKVVEDLRVEPIRKRLTELIGDNKKIELLENIRFDPREEADDKSLAAEWAARAQIYVNDAFASHQFHSSTSAITKLPPSYVGFLVEKEVKTLTKLLKNPEHPFILIMGGAKVEDKIPVIETMADKVDKILLGGVIANTFLKAQGIDTKKSIIAGDQISLAKKILESAKNKIVLPKDLVWDEGMILDIGPKDVEDYSKTIAAAKTIFFNGCLGMTEKEGFEKGTEGIINAIANSAATSILSGGDTQAVLDKMGVAPYPNKMSGSGTEDKISFVSTGGAATLKFLAGKKLPYQLIG